jgi:hypothetical protein
MLTSTKTIAMNEDILLHWIERGIFVFIALNEPKIWNVKAIYLHWCKCNTWVWQINTLRWAGPWVRWAELGMCSFGQAVFLASRSLPPATQANLSEQIERLQKRVFRIIFPRLSYREALSAADCVRLDDNRQHLFQKINSNGDNKLNPLIPNSRLSEHGRPLRNSDSFSIFKCSTDRFKRSFFPALTQYSNNI